MKLKIKKRYLLLLSAFVIIILYLFWGPLFPWNPFKSGYKKFVSSKATIYIDNMTEKDSIVFRIDELLLEEEKFHDLTYKDDFKIIILNKESNMKRYLPWLKGSGYSVSLGIADVIYIGSIARKHPSGIERYIRHELSHLLISQNTTFENGREIHEQAWFVEGTAEYISGHSFYSKKKFIEICTRNNFQFTSLNEQSPLGLSAKELMFNYTYYRFFVEFLINQYGLHKLQEYLREYIYKPGDYKELFINVYSANIDELLTLYSSSLDEFIK